MVEVTIVSSSIVQPKNIQHFVHKKIHLTPHDLDLFYLVYTQRGLLFPKPDPETRFIPRLKAALSAALEIFYPLAGRLVKVENREDDTLSFYIDCDGSGAKFVHAKAGSLSINDLLRFNGLVPDFIRLLYPTNNVENHHALTLEPLLALQVTEMKDGVFVSFGYNHLVADGSSFWKFFHAWSMICLNGSSYSNFKPIVPKYWFLETIDYPIHIPVSEMMSPPNCETSTKEIVFRFSKSKVSSLKAKANNEILFNDAEISSLQAVLAYLWISIIRYCGIDKEETIQCKVAADMRQRLNPPLEKECFGNVTNLAITTIKVGDMSDNGFGWIALQINKTVKSQTNESYKAFAENWVKNVKIPKIGMGSRMANNSLIVTSSPRFEVYDNDFGWGKPIAVRGGPGNGIGGLLVMFCGVEEGSIDVHATLTTSLWSNELLNLLVD